MDVVVCKIREKKAEVDKNKKYKEVIFFFLPFLQRIVDFNFLKEYESLVKTPIYKIDAS